MTAPITVVDPIRIRRKLLELDSRQRETQEKLKNPGYAYCRFYTERELEEIEDQQRKLRLQLQQVADAEAAGVAAKAWAAVDRVTGEIRQADAKAGFAAPVQLAVLATVASGIAGIGGPLQIVAGTLMLAAVIIAAAVVLPWLPRRMPGERGDWLQFGALRGMESAELAKRLSRETSTTEAACLRAVALSRIAHLKHRLIRWSLLTGLAGVLVAAIAAMTGSW